MAMPKRIGERFRKKFPDFLSGRVKIRDLVSFLHKKEITVLGHGTHEDNAKAILDSDFLTENDFLFEHTHPLGGQTKEELERQLHKWPYLGLKYLVLIAYHKPTHPYIEEALSVPNEFVLGYYDASKRVFYPNAKHWLLKRNL